MALTPEQIAKFREMAKSPNEVTRKIFIKKLEEAGIPLEESSTPPEEPKKKTKPATPPASGGDYKTNPAPASDGMAKNKGDRPSPSQHAGATPIGTQAMGNDGHVWEVHKDKNGTHAWRHSLGGSGTPPPAKPTPKPSEKPSAKKPAPKPASKPSGKKPASKPASKPSGKPAPKPSSQDGEEPYDCNELIAEVKEKKAKAKKRREEQAKLPQKTTATKNKEAIKKVAEKVTTSIEKRVEKGGGNPEKGGASVAEIEKMIAEFEEALDNLRKLLKKAKETKMAKGGMLDNAEIAAIVSDAKEVKAKHCGCGCNMEEGGEIQPNMTQYKGIKIPIIRLTDEELTAYYKQQKKFVDTWNPMKSIELTKSQIKKEYNGSIYYGLAYDKSGGVTMKLEEAIKTAQKVIDKFPGVSVIIHGNSGNFMAVRNASNQMFKVMTSPMLPELTLHSAGFGFAQYEEGGNPGEEIKPTSITMSQKKRLYDVSKNKTLGWMKICLNPEGKEVYKVETNYLISELFEEPIKYANDFIFHVDLQKALGKGGHTAGVSYGYSWNGTAFEDEGFGEIYAFEKESDMNLLLAGENVTLTQVWATKYSGKPLPKSENFFENGGEVGDDNEIAEIFVEGYPYYVSKMGDSTHFRMSNTREGAEPHGGAAMVSHVGQHNDRSYISDVKSWLKGGPSPEGKKYASWKNYEQGGMPGDEEHWSAKYVEVLHKRFPENTDKLLGEIDDEEYNSIFFEMVDYLRETYPEETASNQGDDSWANTAVEDYMSNSQYAKGGKVNTEPKIIRGFSDDEGFDYKNGGGVSQNFYEGQSVIYQPTNNPKLDKGVRNLHNKYANMELVIEEIKNNTPYLMAKAFVRSSGEKLPFELQLNPKTVTQYAKGGQVKSGTHRLGGKYEQGGMPRTAKITSTTMKQNRTFFSMSKDRLRGWFKIQLSEKGKEIAKGMEAKKVPYEKIISEILTRVPSSMSEVNFHSNLQNDFRRGGDNTGISYGYDRAGENGRNYRDYEVYAFDKQSDIKRLVLGEEITLTKV